MSGTVQELVAEFAALVERELLTRFDTTDSDASDFVSELSRIAAWVQYIDGQIRNYGCDDRAAMMHTGMTERLLKGLAALGAERTAGTHAEDILIRALAAQGALLALMPVAGNA